MLKLHDYISMDSFGPIMTVKQKLKQEMAFALKLAVFTVVKKKKKKSAFCPKRQLGLTGLKNVERTLLIHTAAFYIHFHDR